MDLLSLASLESVLLNHPYLSALSLVVLVYLLVKIHLMRCVVLDPKKLNEAVKKGIGKPLPEAFDLINKELERLYPGYIVPKSGRKWILFNGGAAMGQMTILHSSLSEYLIFFGSPLYSQGHSGRYLMDVYDFMIQGEHRAYLTGDLTAKLYKPGGEYAFLPMLHAKGYCCEKDGWMLEYGRGIIPLALPYFLCASIFVTVDVWPWLNAVWIVGRNITWNLLVNRKI